MSPKNCPHCGVTGCRFMKWGKTKQKRVRYRCSDCGKTFTNRTGTVRYRSHCSDKQWEDVAKLLALRTCPSGRDLGRFLGVNRKTSQKMLRRLKGFMPPSQAGLPLTGIVEFDESWMQQTWIVGGKSRKTGQLRLYATKVRDAGTLRDIVNQACTYNATAVTDEWKGYTLLKHDRPHYTVNHSKNFVDEHFPGIHTQSIEGCWGNAKPRAKHTHRGYHDLQLFLNHTCFLHNFSHYERNQFLLSITFPHFTNTRLV